MLLDFTLEDALLLHDVVLPAKAFRDEDQGERFSLRQPHPSLSFRKLVMSEIHDTGSLFWYVSAADAVIAAKVFAEEGYTHALLIDDENTLGTKFAVLTSYDFRSAHSITEDTSIVAAFLVYVEKDAEHEYFLDEATQEVSGEHLDPLIKILEDEFEDCGGIIRESPENIQVVVEGTWDKLHHVANLIQDSYKIPVGIVPFSW